MDISNIPEPPNDLAEYDDEVLNAGWLPQLRESSQLQQERKAESRDTPETPIDPESFLRAAYLYQE